jgi:hypothetical protein
LTQKRNKKIKAGTNTARSCLLFFIGLLWYCGLGIRNSTFIFLFEY